MPLIHIKTRSERSRQEIFSPTHAQPSYHTGQTIVVVAAVGGGAGGGDGRKGREEDEEEEEDDEDAPG